MNKDERNKLSAILENLVNEYGAGTKLCDLKDCEFESGGFVGEAVKMLGCMDGGLAVVNQRNWWNISCLEFSSEILQQFVDSQTA